MYEVCKTNRVFREDTGLTRSQTKGIQEDIFEKQYGNTKFLGGKCGREVTKRWCHFSQEFGNIERVMCSNTYIYDCNE